MKFNSLTKKIAGETFVFVTRGRANPFTNEEVTEYLEQLEKFRTFPLGGKDTPKPLKIRDELIPMFLKDMRQFGVKHCVGKYGGTSEQIVAEAARVAPYMTQGFKE
jgi:hypothetical protein